MDERRALVSTSLPLTSEHDTLCKHLFNHRCLLCVTVLAAAGVSGRAGSSHGAGRVQSQAGAVDERLPGRAGERGTRHSDESLKKKTPFVQIKKKYTHKYTEKTEKEFICFQDLSNYCSTHYVL